MGISCEVIRMLRPSFDGLVESTIGGDSPNVTRSMKDADDGDGFMGMRVVDRVRPMKGRTQARRDEWPCRLAFWKREDFFAGSVQRGNQAVCRGLAGVLCDISPDFR